MVELSKARGARATPLPARTALLWGDHAACREGAACCACRQPCTAPGDAGPAARPSGPHLQGQGVVHGARVPPIQPVGPAAGRQGARPSRQAARVRGGQAGLQGLEVEAGAGGRSPSWPASARCCRHSCQQSRTASGQCPALLGACLHHPDPCPAELCDCWLLPTWCHIPCTLPSPPLPCPALLHLPHANNLKLVGLIPRPWSRWWRARCEALGGQAPLAPAGRAGGAAGAEG